MKMIQPVTITAELMDRIDDFYATRSVLMQSTDFEYRRLMRDCEKLKQASAFDGWIVHGLSELLIGDEDAFRKCFDNARALGGPSVRDCDFMFAQALVRIGRRTEALDIYRRIGTPDSGRFGDCTAIGEWIGAFQLLSDMYGEAMEMKLDFKSDTDFETVFQMRELLTADGLSDEQVAGYLDFATMPILERHLVQKSYSVKVVNLDGQKVIHFIFYVDTSGSELADMTIDLADRVAQIDSWPSSMHVSYGVLGNAH